MTSLLFMLLTLNAHARVISTERDLAWLPQPNVSEWIETTELPDGIVTGAYVLARFGNQLLLARHRERGWDIPGGHVDPGETPEQTAVRETFEETGARLRNLRLFAVQRLRITGPKPAGYKYPYPESYQALYVADVAEMEDFVEEEDSVERAFTACGRALESVAWINADLRRAFARALAL